MYKWPFFRILTLMFLLLLQTFVCVAEDIPGLNVAKKQINKLVDSGKSSQAAVVEDQFIDSNPNHPDLPKAISDMADSRAKIPCHDYVRAKVLYNRLIQQYPQSDYAKRARLEKAKIDIFTKIETGNISSAASDVNQMITGDPNNPYLSKALYDTAARYTKRYYFTQADALYDRVIGLFPADSYAEKARFAQIKNNLFSKIKKGEDVNDIISDAVTQYPNDEYLPGVFYFAADKYEENYKYDKAKALYSQTLTADPNGAYGQKSVIELLKVDIYKRISDSNSASANSLTEQLIAGHQNHPYLPEVLYNIADYYRKCFNFKYAKQVYSRLIELFPDDRFSARGQVEMGLLDIRSKIALGTFDPAAGEIEQFKGTQQNNYILARRSYELGDYCLHSHNYEAAIPVLEMVYQQYPEFTYYCTRAKICCDTAKICKKIRDGNLSDAQTAIVSLKQDYASYYYLPGQLYFIARAYSSYGYPEQAGVLCDELINAGESKYAVYGNIHKACLSVRSCLNSGNLTGAKQLFNQFKSEYAGSFYLQEGILDLAREFCDKGQRTEDSNSQGYMEEVIAICQSEEFTEPDLKVQSLTLLAQGYYRLDDFAKSASCYQKIVDEYPDSRSVWQAQFMIGRAYEKMLKAGTISEEEANIQIKSAYQTLLEKYPHCEPVKRARRWLKDHNLE